MRYVFSHRTQSAALISNVFFTVALVGGLSLPSPAWAEEASRAPAAQQRNVRAGGARTAAAPASAPAAPTAPADEKVDISDLEKKYWSTKDTDFNVVQNRLYSKAGRFSVAANYGLLVNDPWSTGQVFNGELAYYPSERFGIQGTYEYIDAQDNTATKEMIRAKGAHPDSNRLRDYFGIAAAWVPFYAKMSVLSSSIIYFDMQVSIGAGMQSYLQQMDTGHNQKQTPAVELNVTQHFFLTKNFAIRLDLKNRWYREEVVYYNSTSVVLGGSRTIRDSVSNATVLTGGLTFLF